MEPGTTPPAAAPDHLTALAVSLGKPFRSAANAPVSLSDPTVAWFVEDGAIDVFLVELSGEKVSSSFKHVLRAPAGRLLFSFPADESEDDAAMAAIGKGLPGCRLRMLMVDTLLSGGVVDEVAEQLDEWVRDVLAALGSGVESHPRPDGNRGGTKPACTRCCASGMRRPVIFCTPTACPNTGSPTRPASGSTCGRSRTVPTGWRRPPRRRTPCARSCSRS